jgi:DNA processing protein
MEKLKQKDKGYPRLLKEISNPPQQLYLIGNLPGDETLKIAIVGTRKATSEGKRLAREIAKKLAERNVVIVSGLAMGIDTAAHEGAILAGGRTIAVLANGLNSIYPRQNENLAKKILELDGAIVSEYSPGAPALEHQFLERNRIISGLSIAAIIIEAPERSGSLATANWAAQQGREVFVFPGPTNHPNYRGSHKLIRDGARLVNSIEDILEDLNLEIPNSLPAGDLPKGDKFQIPKFKITDTNQLLIYKTLQGAGQPLNIDKIIELTKLEPQVINQSLAILIIQGIIKETEKGYTI